MKRIILIISLVLVLGMNSGGLGLPLQADTEDHLANKPLGESGRKNPWPKWLTARRGSTTLPPLKDPAQGDAADLFLPTEEESHSSRTSRTEIGLCSSGTVTLKWDNSTAHDIFYLYGGADQAVWDTTLSHYGATHEYANETFSEAYFDGVDAAIIPMFNRGTLITPAEALAVKKFVDAGGRVLLTGYYDKEYWNYFSENGTNLIAEQFGVSYAVPEGTYLENRYAMVRDPVNNYGQNYELNITNFEDHPITAGVTEWYLQAPSLVVTNPDVKTLANGSLGAYYNTTPTDWINDTDVTFLAVLENEQGGGILFSAGSYLLRNAYTTQHGIDNGYNGSKIVDNVARWLLGVHAPISIQNDGQFSTQAVYENWPGDGSKNTPYVIAGYRIIDPTKSLIVISGTAFHFRIANNYLNGLNGAHEGIDFSNVIYGTIENNIICNNSGPHSGITLEFASTSYNRIINNTIYDNGMGINVGGNNNTIVNNTIYRSETNGMWLNIGTENNIVVGNTIYSNDLGQGGHAGLMLEESHNNLIANNTIDDNPGWLFSSANNTISNNTLSGLGLTASNFNTIANNTITLGSLGVEASKFNTIASNTISSSSGNGIDFANSTNCLIVNNTISNAAFGMYLRGCRHSIIANNTVSYCVINGIDIPYDFDRNIQSYNNTIDGNSVHHITESGIVIGADGGAYNNTVTNNVVCNNGEWGINLPSSSNDNLIANNSVYDNGGGIWIGEATDNTIADNSVSNSVKYSGISFWKVYNSSIVTNTVVESNWPGIVLGSCNNNLIIYNTVSNNAAGGISVRESTENIISGNTIHSNAGEGIHLMDSSNNTISGNAIYNNKDHGIFGGSVHTNRIANNTIWNTAVGIFEYAWGIQLAKSNDNLLINNTIYNNDEAGISFSDCSNNWISQNTIYGHQHGIRLITEYFTPRGSKSNSLVNNRIYDNTEGISLWDESSNNTVAGNSVVNNSDFGIILWSMATDCMIWDNILMDNGVNAKDDGTRNQWDNGSHGNWWGDYSGADWNQDGIGDYPYAITGGGRAQDRYPQVSLTVTLPDATSPSINAPPDVSYAEGTASHFLTWEAVDVHPSWYNITRDGTLVAEGVWSAPVISITIDGLAVGVYTYTLAVYDLQGNSASDSVVVTVTEPSETESATESKTGSATSPGFTITLFLLLGILLFIKHEWARHKQRRGQLGG